MHIKELCNHVPLPATIKLVWDHITFSRLTTAYFIFSILHFSIQLSLQIKVFTTNADAALFLNNIVVQGQAVNDSLPFLQGSTLRMCSWVPSNLDVDDGGCPVVWNGTQGNNVIGTQPDEVNDGSAAASGGFDLSLSSTIETSSISISTATSSAATSSAATSSTATSSTISFSPTKVHTTVTSTSSSLPQTITIFVGPRPTSGILGSSNDDDDDDDDDDDSSVGDDLFKREIPHILAFQEAGQTKINISGMGFENTPATLDKSCIWALNWPVSVLDNTKREDLVFIAFQFWVLGMSIVALLNESIPHILASLLTHMMATSWAAFQISHTANFRSNFNRVITNGACNGTSLLPNYWEDRGTAEIASLALNIFALLISCFLTWKLIKLFGWQTFKRVGASLTINRVYKLVLLLSITIQLSLFFMVVTVSLWIDQLVNSTIGDLADFQTLYKVTSIITLVLLIPWLMTGWFAVRRELRMPMFFFLLLSFLYLGGWSVMFFSITFRWTFVTWRFFSIMASASVFLTVMSFALGIVCRFNFGKGLLRYLNAQQSLPGDDFVYYGSSDIEKVDFPSNEKPIPTYSATFGSGPDVLPPSQMFVSRGPRFFDRSAPPFESGSRPPVTAPPNAYTIVRKVSDGSSHSGSVARSDSHSSNKSFGTLASFYTYGEHSHTRNDSQQRQRWVIE